MRIPVTVMIIAIAMLASPLAYGQARTSPPRGHRDQSERFASASRLGVVLPSGVFFHALPLPKFAQSRCLEALSLAGAAISSFQIRESCSVAGTLRASIRDPRDREVMLICGVDASALPARDGISALRPTTGALLVGPKRSFTSSPSMRAWLGLSCFGDHGNRSALN